MLKTLVLGTRASALALAQTDLTRAALLREFPELEVRVETFVTRGDKKMDISLIQQSEQGGKGLFTKELEDALLTGIIDVAVHSMKDLPGHTPPGLEVTAVLERAATADMLISKHSGGLRGLPAGVAVGTSSIRRARQLQWLRPDLSIQEHRGNVQTRLRKLGESATLGAIILAQAGLERLDFAVSAGSLAFEAFTFHTASLAEDFLPAIGQGAIALQSRSDRHEITEVLVRITHEQTFIATRAERELQRLLAGDCTLPVGVRTTINGAELAMSAVLFCQPGETPRTSEARGSITEPEQIAARLCAGLHG